MSGNAAIANERMLGKKRVIADSDEQQRKDGATLQLLQ